MLEPSSKRPLQFYIEIVRLPEHEPPILVDEFVESFEKGRIILHAVYSQFDLQVPHYFLLEEEVPHLAVGFVSGHQTLVTAFVQLLQ